MLDPFTYALRAQHAAAIGAFCVGGSAVAGFLRLLKGETALLMPTMHRRAVEQHVPTTAVPRGAGWTDHYGRRSHDVDVEHLR